MANSNAVVQAILAATQNPQVQAAMLMGSKLESGWNTSSVGDQGTSFGPFQIHLPAHPGVTSQEAENASWAVNYMLPAYEAGVDKVPASLWQADPAQAAATAAFYAERPAKMYSGYEALWATVNAALNGTSVATGGAQGTTGTGTGTATEASSVASSLFGPVETDVNTILNDMYMGAVILVGLALMVAGFVFIFKGTVGVKDAMTVNVKGMGNGSNSSSGRNSNIGASSGTTNQGPPTANPRIRSTVRTGRTAKAGGLNTGRAVAGTAVGHSVTATAGRPKPKRTITIPANAQRKAKP